VRDRRAATLLGIGLAALAALWARRRFARSWAQGPAARPPAGPKRGEAQAGVRRSSAGGRWLLSAAAGVLLLGWCGVRGARAALGPIAEPSASAEWPWPLVGQLERRQGCLRLRLPSGELWPDELRFAEAVPRSGEPLALLGPGQRRPFAQGPASPRRAPFGVLELEPDEVLRLEGGRPNLWSRLDLWASDRRGALEQRLVRAGGDPGTGLGRALLLGDRSGMDAEISDLFRRTGTAHLLALSGMHVSLLFAALLWPGACGLARLGQRLLPGADGLWSRLPTALALTGLCVFAWLAGAASPVLRASLCCALALRGRGRLRTDRPPPAPADGRTLFAAALLFELSLDPGAVLELATVLSYASTAGLIWLYAPLQRLLRGRATGSAPRLAAAGPLAVWARAGAGRLKGFLIGGLAATLAAQLMTLPWQWLVFRELTWAAGPATLTGLVLMTAWLPLLWAAALLESSALGACSRFVEGCQLALLEAFDRMPGTPWVVPEKPTLLVLGLCAATLWALLRRSAMAARIASAAGALLLLPGGPTPAQGELVALDVGHGSALCLRMPGLPALVFDAGSRDRPGLGRRALAPLLARWDPGSLVLVSSHLDQDHSAALPWLRSRWPVELLAGAPAWPGSPPRHDLFAGRSSLPLPRCTVPLSLLRAGEGDRNEGSRSLLVELPGSALLLFGDSVGAGLLGLLDAGLLPERAALALAPHHGSDGPGIGPWLDRWPPETVWISGPAGAPLEAELERRGLPWRSTGRQGWLALEFGPGSRDPPAVGR
jgi:competence protein ComEC